jgi:hypothetical protein
MKLDTAVEYLIFRLSRVTILTSSCVLRFSRPPPATEPGRLDFHGRPKYQEAYAICNNLGSFIADHSAGHQFWHNSCVRHLFTWNCSTGAFDCEVCALTRCRNIVTTQSLIGLNCVGVHAQPIFQSSRNGRPGRRFLTRKASSFLGAVFQG